MRNKRRTKKRSLKMYRKASGQSNYTDGKRVHPIWHHLIARTILGYLRSTKSRSRSWLIFCFLKRSMQLSPQKLTKQMHHWMRENIEKCIIRRLREMKRIKIWYLLVNDNLLYLLYFEWLENMMRCKFQIGINFTKENKKVIHLLNFGHPL